MSQEDRIAELEKLVQELTVVARLTTPDRIAELEKRVDQLQGMIDFFMYTIHHLLPDNLERRKKIMEAFPQDFKK